MPGNWNRNFLSRCFGTKNGVSRELSVPNCFCSGFSRGRRTEVRVKPVIVCLQLWPSCCYELSTSTQFFEVHMGNVEG